MLQTQNLLFSNFPFTLSLTHNHKLFLSPPTHSSPFSSLHRPISFHSVSPLTTHHCFCLPQFSELADATFLDDNGPVELPSTIFATTDDPSSLQVATSVLLTGAISVFLFRSLRRRAKRVKELVLFTTFLFTLWLTRFCAFWVEMNWGLLDFLFLPAMCSKKFFIEAACSC